MQRGGGPLPNDEPGPGSAIQEVDQNQAIPCATETTPFPSRTAAEVSEQSAVCTIIIECSLHCLNPEDFSGSLHGEERLPGLTKKPVHAAGFRFFLDLALEGLCDDFSFTVDVELQVDVLDM